MPFLFNLQINKLKTKVSLLGKNETKIIADYDKLKVKIINIKCLKAQRNFISSHGINRLTVILKNEKENKQNDFEKETNLKVQIYYTMHKIRITMIKQFFSQL